VLNDLTVELVPYCQSKIYILFSNAISISQLLKFIAFHAELSTRRYAQLVLCRRRRQLQCMQPIQITSVMPPVARCVRYTECSLHQSKRRWDADECLSFSAASSACTSAGARGDDAPCIVGLQPSRLQLLSQFVQDKDAAVLTDSW